MQRDNIALDYEMIKFIDRALEKEKKDLKENCLSQQI
jgi:hypothetical protein